MAGRDITEGRGDSSGNARAIAFDVGIVSSGAIWQNTDIAYDVAVGGIPFIYAISDARPYVRQTAPYRKDQFDNGVEPGEQSLTGWWIRSKYIHQGLYLLALQLEVPNLRFLYLMSKKEKVVE